MVQRNIDLEKAAWKLVEEQRRAHNFQEAPPSYGTVLYNDDESALQQALELSKKEFDLKRQMEEDELRHLIAMAEAQWATERNQCAQVPTVITNTTESPTVPNTTESPTVPNTTESPTVPNTTESTTVPNTQVASSVYNTPAVLPKVGPSEEGSCTPVKPGVTTLGLPPENMATNESHTPQPLTNTVHLTVDRASHTAHPQAETNGSQVSFTFQGPGPIISLVGPPSRNDISGAEAAAQWIESAREELSSSPDHTSLHKVMYCC